MNMQDFRDALRLRMEALGLTQMDVVRLCGIQQGSLSRFLAGEAGLSGENILRLARVVGVPQVFQRRGRPRQQKEGR